MAEYIERDAALYLFGEVPAYTGYETYPVGVHTLICEIAPLIKDAIRKIPSEDVAPVRHGRWLPQVVLGQKAWDCSECKTLGSPHWKWCPVCGAKMDGET